MSAVGAPRHFLGNVQALRAIAALFVVLVHAGLPNVGVESIMSASDGPWLWPFHYIGLFGVDLFFVISGFIMVVTNWEHFGRRFAGPRFLARRAIRIYPPYWLALAPVLAIFFLAKNQLMGSHVGEKTGIIESILLLPNPHKFVLTVAWTLVWEMIFYVVFTALLGLQRAALGVALGVWFGVQLALYVAFNGSSNFFLNFAATPLPMEFIFGAFVGMVYLRGWFPAPRLAAGLALAIALTMWVGVTAGKVLLENPNSIARVMIFGLPAMLLVYGGVALEVRGVYAAPRQVQAVGDGSYAIYLWHLSILVAIRHLVERFHPAGPVAHAAIITVTLGIVVAVGMLVYRFFERPVTAYLNARLVSRSPQRTSPASAVARGAAVGAE